MIHPNILLSLYTENEIHTGEGKQIITTAKKRLQSMDIFARTIPEEFSDDEKFQWITDVFLPYDFFMQVVLTSPEKKISVYYKSSEEEKIAHYMSKEIGNRLDRFYKPAQEFSELESPLKDFLERVPLHSWVICIPYDRQKTQEIIMTIMACVSDLYFSSDSLLDESKKWPYRDVPSDHFAFEAIKKAKEKGVIKGYRGDILRPNGGITRGELFFILDKLDLL